jgi:uridylate kinase
MSKFGVDGVYDRDPRRDPGNAVFLAELDASDALDRKLAVMDATALAMARDHGKPIHVIPASETWGPRHVVEGKQFGSKILPQ